MNSIKKRITLRVFVFGIAVCICTVASSQALEEPLRLNPHPVQFANWQLGVGVKNLRGGCAITRVLPQSSAKQAGLEPGDIILSVNGAPVGYTGGVLNDLEDELNRQADALGRVTLRVRNGRNGAVARVPVRLAPAPKWQPPVAPPWWDWQPKKKEIIVQPVDPVRDTLDTMYLRYFGRRPDNVGLRNWLTQIEKGMRIEEVHANILASAEFYDRCQNNEEEWIAQMYLLLTGRRGNPREIREWVRNLNTIYRGQRLLLARDFLKAIGQY